MLLRIAPVMIHEPIKQVLTYFLCDEAFTVTLVDSALAKDIRIRGEKESFSFVWSNNSTREESESDGKTYEKPNARTVNNLALLSQTMNVEKLQKQNSYLKVAELNCFEDATPMIPIWKDYVEKPSLDKSSKHRKLRRWSIMATKTVLGWVAHGQSVRIHRKVSS